MCGRFVCLFFLSVRACVRVCVCVCVCLIILDINKWARLRFSVTVQDENFVAIPRDYFKESVKNSKDGTASSNLWCHQPDDVMQRGTFGTNCSRFTLVAQRVTHLSDFTLDQWTTIAYVWGIFQLWSSLQYSRVSICCQGQKNKPKQQKAKT